MTTLREFKIKLDKFIETHPETLDLMVLGTDDQCAHYDVSNIMIQDVEEWPTEYCIDETLPEKATQFVRF